MSLNIIEVFILNQDQNLSVYPIIKRLNEKMFKRLVKEDVDGFSDGVAPCVTTIWARRN
ncbi:hypothetical protein [Halalkalibacter sp. APA_J-10(15)]|uniref:hypothetical protein n=1 Tax=Halalkalibacter sp. APA_J-10(15) TaxID=2933805 RepID=UPI001FF51B64|nr:hypothetical protein [Halalkalibacter sp. APA_J-10(15)]